VTAVGNWVVIDPDAMGIRTGSAITWSPDGQYIAFSGRLVGSNADQIVRAAIGFDESGAPVASDVRTLTTFTKVLEIDPSWSPAWVPGR
jgi:Tol biopolymer transport system component